MFPDEIQAIMAKLLLILFATFLFCFNRARASDSLQIPPVHAEVLTQSSSR